MMEHIELKCNFCNNVKTVDKFPILTKGRKPTQCRDCFNVYLRDWKKKNRDKVKAQEKRYLDQPDKRKARYAYIHQRYLDNTDNIRAINKASKIKNKDAQSIRDSAAGKLQVERISIRYRKELLKSITKDPTITNNPDVLNFMYYSVKLYRDIYN